MQKGGKLIIVSNKMLAYTYRFFGVVLVLVAILLILQMKIEATLFALPILAVGAAFACISPLTLIFDKKEKIFLYYLPYPIYETATEFLFFKRKIGERKLADIKAIKHIRISHWGGQYWHAKLFLALLLKGGEQVSFSGIYEHEAKRVAAYLGLPLLRGSSDDMGRFDKGLRYLKPPENSPESMVDGRFDEPGGKKITITRRNV